MINNCERCCFNEFCTKNGRKETKNCVYGKKSEEEHSDKSQN